MAGERGSDGQFPPGTINRIVDERLRQFALQARAFARSGGERDGATS
jgi:hypothetical protein